MRDQKPKIAILGAGPTGLEAALAAAEHGFPFTVYEAAPRVAGEVRSWGYVRLFTPWSMNVSARMRKSLEEAGHSLPDSAEVCPTGAELVEQLYEPLARLPRLQGSLRCGVRVLHVGRRGLLKHEEIGTAERGAHPFRLLLEEETGPRWSEEADLVLDCTGNTVPNALGDGGIPAPGEEGLADALSHEIPALEGNAGAWAGKTVLLIGAGHSAQTALLGLVELAREHPGTRIVWLLRSAPPSATEDDPLPERARLTGLAAQLGRNPPPFLEIRTGMVIDKIESNGRPRITLGGTGADREEIEVDRVLALTGRIGDHRLYRQLQVHECYATSGPMKLAAALLGASGGSGDCLAQTSLGPETLENPEPGFFILGIKSYGRRTDFLMRVGWQQVDEVFHLLDGG